MTKPLEAPAPEATEKPLTPAARRALEEAAARRTEREAQARAAPPEELGGRGGLDPVRYDDWEVRGVAVDF